ncbi:MAG TPA: ATP-binding protein [Actinomycetota bacterium]|nr:ATP-binding protein [Actinomycetota bacterium]
MSSRPLERLPTIRGKLGATIVVAVAITIMISYALIGFALRNSPRDSEAIDALALARRVASGELAEPPAGTMVVRRSLTGEVTVEGVNLGVLPPDTPGRVPRWGVIGNNVWASIPTDEGGSLIVLYPSPTRGSLGRVSATLGFLQSVWWQFLLAGAIAAVIALVMARWLARGMTQPLRDMAEAARRMETGDYSTRVYTTSRDEVGQLAAAFNRMSRELETLETSRRDLVANVSHELKTPITAIRAHLENLLDGVEEPDNETLQVMLAQSERLGRLVEQLLDLSKLESGDVPLRREQVALAPLVAQVMSEIQVASADRDVEVSSALPDDLPPIEADAERVHQVIFNLVDNAVRFTPEGGEVRIEAQRHNGAVEVRVADTGVGIPAEALPRLFERFYRVDAARARGDGGTGIGLAIARSVVEAHGGTIRAESEPGHGSTFSFDLPIAVPAGSGVTNRRDP